MIHFKINRFDVKIKPVYIKMNEIICFVDGAGRVSSYADKARLLGDGKASWNRTG